jgi:hypothetical protein
MTVMNEVNARTADRAAGARATRTAVLDDLQRQHRISHNGLRAVLSGARWLSGQEWLASSAKAPKIEQDCHSERIDRSGRHQPWYDHPHRNNHRIRTPMASTDGRLADQTGR